MGPPDLESSDCLQLKPLAGGQEAKRGPGAEHLISACSWVLVLEGGRKRGGPQPYVPLGGYF